MVVFVQFLPFLMGRAAVLGNEGQHAAVLFFVVCSHLHLLSKKQVKGRVRKRAEGCLAFFESRGASALKEEFETSETERVLGVRGVLFFNRCTEAPPLNKIVEMTGFGAFLRARFSPIAVLIPLL